MVTKLIFSILISFSFISLSHAGYSSKKLRDDCNAAMEKKKEEFLKQNAGQVYDIELAQKARSENASCKQSDENEAKKFVTNFKLEQNHTYSDDSIGDTDSDTSVSGNRAILEFNQYLLSSGEPDKKSISTDFSVNYVTQDDPILEDKDSLNLTLAVYRNPNDIPYDDFTPENGSTSGILFSYSDADDDIESFKSKSVELRNIYSTSIGGKTSLYDFRSTAGIKAIDSDRDFETGYDAYVDLRLRHLNQTYNKFGADGHERIFPRLYVSHHGGQDGDAQASSTLSLQAQWRWWKELARDHYVNFSITAGVDRIENFRGDDDSLTSVFVMPMISYSYNSNNTGGAGSGGSSGGNWYRP